MMVVLLLYAYCVGLPSSRKIEKACWEVAAFRVLIGNQQPDHSRITDFRRRHPGSLSGLFVQVLKVCQKAGMVSLGHVALDGTKLRAEDGQYGKGKRGDELPEDLQPRSSPLKWPKRSLRQRLQRPRTVNETSRPRLPSRSQQKRTPAACQGRQTGFPSGPRCPQACR